MREQSSTIIPRCVISDQATCVESVFLACLVGPSKHILFRTWHDTGQNIELVACVREIAESIVRVWSAGVCILHGIIYMVYDTTSSSMSNDRIMYLVPDTAA